MRKYDHLFFDLDNTLWDFDANSKLALKETMKELNIADDVPFEEFYKVYAKINDILWKAYRKKEVSKAELTKIRFEKPLQKFELAHIDPVEMNRRYLSQMPLQNQLVEGAVETLDYLKAKGYQMHIITNGFTEVQHKKLNNSGLNKYFKWVFISEEIQAPKPDKRVFQHALKNCNARKMRSIMIGDSWDSDILGASNFGMDQAFYMKTQITKDTYPHFSNTPEEKLPFLSITPSNMTYLLTKLTHLKKIL